MLESTPNYRDLFRRAAIYADKMMVTLRARMLGHTLAGKTKGGPEGELMSDRI
jgi:hypothetical protein